MQRRIRPIALFVLLSLFTGLAFSLAAAPTQGEKYALLVGVRKYDPNELHSLPYSEPDVVELAQVLEASGYRKENVVLMTQTAGAEESRFQPEADKVRKELKLLLADRDEGDTVLVAF